MNSRRYVICDIEATGLDADTELIEIALITYEDERVVDVYETLINPLRSVPTFIQELTSIAPRELENAPKFYEVADAIRLRLEGNIFVSHNTDFDLNLLMRKYEELGQELKVKSFCTLKVAQNEIPGLKNYNLDALCSFFGIKIKERHRAIGDARATLGLFQELFDLRFKATPKKIYLPHHERYLKKIPSRAGLLKFKDEQGKIIRSESSFDMLKRAKELLEIRPENKNLLLHAESIDADVTGSALIAEFKQISRGYFHYRYTINAVKTKSGEMEFKIFPWKKHMPGLWYFFDYPLAKKKLKQLQFQLKGQSYAYREGGKSKEEIILHNQKVDSLSKEAKFPSENLLILGEGREAAEKSLILVRDGHVKGYGYSKASDADIYQHPEDFLTKRYSQHSAIDLATITHLRVLKNLRNKTEGWRSLSEHAKVSSI